MTLLNSTCSDNVNETWNGMLYSLDNGLFVSSEENKPATISKMVWRMNSDLGYGCNDGGPQKIQGTMQELLENYDKMQMI
uniref:Uncharacterized protein n=1 Tax=Romanomermis culicivorax TaxID=13658 RepID=A0A915IGN7_ROMCU